MQITPEWVSAVSTVILVLATMIYVYYTTQLAKETTKLREIETSPFISAYLHIFKKSPNIEFVFENIGKAPAYNLEISFDTVAVELFEKNELHLHPVKINYLPVGTKESYFVGAYDKLKATGLNEVNICLKYNSKDGVELGEQIRFNFDYMGDAKLLIGIPYEIEENKRNFDNLVKAVEKVEKAIEKKGNG